MSQVDCKYCQAPNPIRFGTRKGVQYYFCKACKRKFVTGTLPKMKTSAFIVASAVGQYFRGMPLDSIQGQLKQDYDLDMSEWGIYKWVERFAQKAVKEAKTFKPKVGDVWLADETVLKINGRNYWFWDLIDEKTRFLLASRFSSTRTIKDAEALMIQAYGRAGKAPKKICTDKLAAYLDGIENVFGANTKHIQTSPFGREGGDESTSIIERFHGTLKERTGIMHGFKSLVKSKLITDAWLVHYNFFKEHTSLDDVPPAQNMGIPVPFKDWRDVVGVREEPKPNPQSAIIVRRPKRLPAKSSRPKAPRRVVSQIRKRRAVRPSLSRMRR